jgi:uncharacterized protein
MAKPAHANPIHALTIAAMAKGLGNMAQIMDTAAKHAAAHDVSLENYLQARLFPDMFNLLQQLQYVCYLSVDFARHFSAAAAPRVGYDEATWSELRESLDTAQAYLLAIAPDELTTQADKVLPTFMDDSKGMPTVGYAANVIIPDFYFHMTVAYALLRHNGVPLGKSDYLGALDMKAL